MAVEGCPLRPTPRFFGSSGGPRQVFCQRAASRGGSGLSHSTAGIGSTAAQARSAGKTSTSSRCESPVQSCRQTSPLLPGRWEHAVMNPGRHG